MLSFENRRMRCSKPYLPGIGEDHNRGIACGKCRNYRLEYFLSLRLPNVEAFSSVLLGA